MHRSFELNGDAFVTMRCLAFLIFLLISEIAAAQNRLTAVIVDSTTNDPVSGATVRVEGTTLATAASVDGSIELANIPDGWHIIRISCIGYSIRELSLFFPLEDHLRPLVIRLSASNIQLGGVAVTTTRTSYHLGEAPIRVEIKGTEDIEETMLDHPASISELFLESTGIQLSQTSAVSNYVNIKLQGLDGSYTQILKDGFPLYGGLSSGLSVAQIPPLDLARVEIVKGPSGSLYGGGAIAGIINLISAKPDPDGKLVLFVNGESDRGISTGSYYSKQYDEHVGVTMALNGDVHGPYDNDHSGFSDVPQKKAFTVNPRIFYTFDERTKLSFGVSTASEVTTGGDMTAVSDGTSGQHPYLEKNNSSRTYSQLEASTVMGSTVVSLKNSIGYFSLSNSVEAMNFVGRQWMSFTELSVESVLGAQTIAGGLTFTTDRFVETPASIALDRSYRERTLGVFGQDDWRISSSVTLELGARLEKVNTAAVDALPRVGMRYRFSDEVTVRASAGMGSKAPTLFSDQSSPYAVFGLMPVSSAVAAEKSAGGECDVEYDLIAFGELSIACNQAFFYTRVNHPFIIIPAAGSASPAAEVPALALVNADGFLFSQGAESTIKLNFGDIEAFIGYSYTDVKNRFASSESGVFMTPKHKLVTDILYDLEELGELGTEIRYTSSQQLHDGSVSPGYWILDMLLRKKFGPCTFFAGAENVFNFKQADYLPVVSGGSLHPRFSDVWAPIEGRVINAGLKFEIR